MSGEIPSGILNREGGTGIVRNTVTLCQIPKKTITLSLDRKLDTHKDNQPVET